MGALGELDARSGARILELAKGVDPGAGCVHDGPGPHADLLAGRGARVDGGDVAVVHVESDDLAARRDRRATGGSRPRDGDDEARVVGLVVVVHASCAQPVGPQRGGQRQRAGGRDHQRGAVAEPRERAVGDHARADRDRAVRAVGAQRHAEAQRAHEVGSDDAGQRTALGVRLAHELHIAHAQVPEAAVDELGGRTRRPRGEVVAFEQRDAESSPCGDPRHPAADDPATDDHDVELLVSKGRCGGVVVHPCCVSRPRSPCNFVLPK